MGCSKIVKSTFCCSPFEIVKISKRLKILLEGNEKCIGIDAVCRAGLFKGLAACKRAAHAMHSYLLESGHCFGAILKDLGNKGLSRNFHVDSPFLK